MRTHIFLAAFILLSSPTFAVENIFSSCPLIAELTYNDSTAVAEAEDLLRDIRPMMAEARKRLLLREKDRENAEKILALSEDLLKRNGVESVRKGDQLIISDSGRAALNTYAKALKDRYNARYVFNPLELMKSRAAAAYDAASKTLFASVDSVFYMATQKEFDGHEELHSYFGIARELGVGSLWDFVFSNEYSPLRTYAKFRAEELATQFFSLVAAVEKFRDKPGAHEYHRMHRHGRTIVDLMRRMQDGLSKIKSRVFSEEPINSKEMEPGFTYYGRSFLIDRGRVTIPIIDNSESLSKSLQAERELTKAVVATMLAALPDEGVTKPFDGNKVAKFTMWLLFEATASCCVISNMPSGESILSYDFAGELDGAKGELLIPANPSPDVKDALQKYQRAKAAASARPFPEAGIRAEMQKKILGLEKLLQQLSGFPEMVSLIKEGNPDTILQALRPYLKIVSDAMPLVPREPNNP